ncbi:MAG: sigma-70 family RNA polymerase sigma factor [Clostridia bacterium]|nr:sigma-70 family RNA polymerase sigma factor [Clostridia bacterium]
MTDEKNERINECLTEIRTKQSVSHVELLYDLMGPTIRHIALKYLRDADAAEDLVQDFWADIDRIAAGFLLRRNGRAYLCRVAANRATNRYRRLKGERARVTYVDYSVCLPVDPTEGDEQTVLRLSVEQAMGQLSEEERIVVQATYFEEKTVRRTAAEMGTSASRVSRLKKQALERLKEMLE